MILAALQNPGLLFHIYACPASLSIMEKNCCFIWSWFKRHRFVFPALDLFGKPPFLYNSHGKAMELRFSKSHGRDAVSYAETTVHRLQ